MTTDPGDASLLGVDTQSRDIRSHKDNGAGRAAVSNRNYNENIISGTVGVLINNNPVINNFFYGDAPNELVCLNSGI